MEKSEEYSTYATNLFFTDTESDRAKRFQDRNSIFIVLFLVKFRFLPLPFNLILSCYIESYEKLLLLFNADIHPYIHILRKRFHQSHITVPKSGSSLNYRGANGISNAISEKTADSEKCFRHKKFHRILTRIMMDFRKIYDH